MVKVMVFNETFNNISAISWLSVLLVEETGVSGENHAPTCQKSLTNTNRLNDIVNRLNQILACHIKIKDKRFSILRSTLGKKKNKVLSLLILDQLVT
jgi:hypothetical protein